VTGRLLAWLIVCALVVGGTAVAGFGEPQPAERIMPVGSLIPPEHPATASPLRKAEVERPEPPAAFGTLPASSVDREVSVSSPARAASPERPDTLGPAGGFSDIRSKP
jgi:hypothetical protein